MESVTKLLVAECHANGTVFVVLSREIVGVNGTIAKSPHRFPISAADDPGAAIASLNEALILEEFPAISAVDQEKIHAAVTAARTALQG